MFTSEPSGLNWKHPYLVKCLVYKHTAINDSLAVRWWLGQFVIDDGHVVWDLVVWFLQIHLAGKLLTHLVQGLCGPVSKPVQHAPKTKKDFHLNKKRHLIILTP